MGVERRHPGVAGRLRHRLPNRCRRRGVHRATHRHRGRRSQGDDGLERVDPRQRIEDPAEACRPCAGALVVARRALYEPGLGRQTRECGGGLRPPDGTQVDGAAPPCAYAVHPGLEWRRERGHGGPSGRPTELEVAHSRARARQLGQGRDERSVCESQHREHQEDHEYERRASIRPGRRVVAAHD
jgi:hypothetical protein